MIVRFAVSASIALVLLFFAVSTGTRIIQKGAEWRDPDARPEQVPLLLADTEQVDGERAEDFGALRRFLRLGLTARLDAALARGDRRPLGIAGTPLTVPGLSAAQRPSDDADVHPIPGATDAPHSDEHAALVDRARQYASAYNALLLRRTAGEGDDEDTSVPGYPSSDATAASAERSAPSGDGATR